MKKYLIYFSIIFLLSNVSCTIIPNQLNVSPYNIGIIAAETYMKGKKFKPEYAEAARLAYLVLEEIVTGPEQTSIPNNLEKFVIEYAHRNGYDSILIPLAIGAIKDFRPLVRDKLSQYKTVEESYQFLTEFKQGIDDRIKLYEKVYFSNI